MQAPTAALTAPTTAAASVPLPSDLLLFAQQQQQLQEWLQKLEADPATQPPIDVAAATTPAVLPPHPTPISGPSASAAAPPPAPAPVEFVTPVPVDPPLDETRKRKRATKYDPDEPTAAAAASASSAAEAPAAKRTKKPNKRAVGSNGVDIGHLSYDENGEPMYTPSISAGAKRREQLMNRQPPTPHLLIVYHEPEKQSSAYFVIPVPSLNLDDFNLLNSLHGPGVNRDAVGQLAFERLLRKTNVKSCPGSPLEYGKEYVMEDLRVLEREATLQPKSSPAQLARQKRQRTGKGFHNLWVDKFITHVYDISFIWDSREIVLPPDPQPVVHPAQPAAAAAVTATTPNGAPVATATTDTTMPANVPIMPSTAPVAVVPIAAATSPMLQPTPPQLSSGVMSATVVTAQPTLDASTSVQAGVVTPLSTYQATSPALAPTSTSQRQSLQAPSVPTPPLVPRVSLQADPVPITKISLQADPVPIVASIASSMQVDPPSETTSTHPHPTLSASTLQEDLSVHQRQATEQKLNTMSDV